MEIPTEFKVIEGDLYSARAAPEFSHQFIKSLKLNTIVLLDPAVPSKALQQLIESEHINLHHLIPESWRPSHESTEHHQTWISISRGLKLCLNKNNYPLMILGSQLLGAIVRKLQNWTLSAVLNEYNTYFEPSGVRGDAGGSYVLELTKLCYGRIEEAKSILEEMAQREPNTPVIIVDMPREEDRAEWVHRFVSVPNCYGLQLH